VATREELTIALRILAYLNANQSDLRSNANSYLAEIATGHQKLSTTELGAKVRADALAISALMTRMGNFLSVPARQTKATNGLAFFGILAADANTDRLMIKSAADIQAAADVTTDVAITAAANATLAAVPAIDTFG
jgi:hypothetical protein